MPQRIQRRRAKGWRAPEGAVYVGRGSKWGNPFVIDEKAETTNRKLAVASFRSLLRASGTYSPIPPHKWPRRGGMLKAIPKDWISIDDIKRELRGKDLMCWCPLDQPCHADVLLEIANA